MSRPLKGFAGVGRVEATSLHLKQLFVSFGRAANLPVRYEHQRTPVAQLFGMSSFRHAFHSAYKAGAEMVLPVRKESAFKEEGVLTPEEFVLSGDHLVRTCPTWAWQGGDHSKAKSYVPKDKQFLITRNVPSNKRASAVEHYGEAAEQLLRDGDEDEWVAPPSEHPNLGSADGETESIPQLAAAPPQAAPHAAQDDDDIPDINDLELDEPEEDTVVSRPGHTAGVEGEDDIVRTRTYDLMITYDKYYQVPRFWLVGYDENRQPLKPVQILEDVSEEHARKTITVDPFPHSAVTAASIHPCKHAVVMKKLVSMAEASGKPFRVEHYMIFFLKFIASVIPTIQYDNTMTAGL